MRLHLLIFVAMATLAAPLRAEIHDVLKSAEIDALFAKTEAAFTAHEAPTYSIVFRVNDGKAGPYAMHRNADELWFVRRGNAQLEMGRELRDSKESSPGESVGSGIRQPRRHEIGAGDIVNLPRNTAYQVDPGSGRLEYVAVRISPSDAHPLRQLGEPSPMGDVVKKAQRDATFANHDSNQPLHSVKNASLNFVIYTGRPGPWEAHRGCADIYFVYTGAGIAHLGGTITNTTEDVPGEIRGDGVHGARESEIGPGDIVLIPHNTAHYVVPTTKKLGYNLVKVWAL